MKKLRVPKSDYTKKKDVQLMKGEVNTVVSDIFSFRRVMTCMFKKMVEWSGAAQPQRGLNQSFNMDLC